MHGAKKKKKKKKHTIVGIVAWCLRKQSRLLSVVTDGMWDAFFSVLP